MNSKKPKARDYKAEYQRRIASGKARGYSCAQASGHPKPSEIGIIMGRKIIEEHKEKERRQNTILMVATSPCVGCPCTEGTPETCVRLDEWLKIV